MPKPFKNALCLAMQPDAYGVGYGSWHHSCHRHRGHPGMCRTRWREWNRGDIESRERASKGEGGEG